jgi:hypothetical protein
MQILGSQITIIKTYVIIIAGRVKFKDAFSLKKTQLCGAKQAPTTSIKIKYQDLQSKVF